MEMRVDTAPQTLFLDDAERGLFRFSPKIYSDPDIFERERRRIFNRVWLYAGHESEVPQAGDFLTRRVGGRPLIIVRGSDSQIRIFHNSCRHRGATVCRHTRGNTKHFTCFYHNWTYNNQGRLDGVPLEDAYGPAFKMEEMGLYQPRLQSYRGWLFVCFSRETEGLEDYLAGALAYLDMILDQDEGGNVVLPGTHEYSMRANWKLLMENTIDIYHLNSTHRRYLKNSATDTSSSNIANSAALRTNPSEPHGRPGTARNAPLGCSTTPGPYYCSRTLSSSSNAA
jgi:p-cumate 2,3-dioxygenase subunit alpha